MESGRTSGPQPDRLVVRNPRLRVAVTAELPTHIEGARLGRWTGVPSTCCCVSRGHRNRSSGDVGQPAPRRGAEPAGATITSISSSATGAAPARPTPLRHGWCGSPATWRRIRCSPAWGRNRSATASTPTGCCASRAVCARRSNVLMDSRKLVGVGNIYASEASSRPHPSARARRPPRSAALCAPGRLRARDARRRDRRPAARCATLSAATASRLFPAAVLRLWSRRQSCQFAARRCGASSAPTRTLLLSALPAPQLKGRRCPGGGMRAACNWHAREPRSGLW